MTQQSVGLRPGFRRHLRPAGFVALTLAVTGGLQAAFVVGGAVSALVGATIGLVWALGAAFLTARFIGDRPLGVASNTPLFAGVVTTGLVFAAGLFGAIEHSGVELTEHAVAELFHSPAADNMGVFFNIANGSTEWLIMPAVVLLAWQAGGRRRYLVITAAVVFYLVRAWTYLYFGPHVVANEAAISRSGGAVPASVMADAQHWIALNQVRTVLDALVYILLLLAAFVALRRSQPTIAQLPKA